MWSFARWRRNEREADLYPKYASHLPKYYGSGPSGMAHYTKKAIREQLHIPKGEKITRVIHQKRMTKKTGKVWYFEVETQ